MVDLIIQDTGIVMVERLVKMDTTITTPVPMMDPVRTFCDQSSVTLLPWRLTLMDFASIMSESYGGTYVSTRETAVRKGSEVGQASSQMCSGEGGLHAPESDQYDGDFVYHVDHRHIEQNIIAMMQSIYE